MLTIDFIMLQMLTLWCLKVVYLLITKEENLNIDYGLNVTFDGKKYTLMCTNYIRDYPIGGLISEYCRLAPTKIKDIILSCPNLYDVPNVENMTETLMKFYEKLLKNFDPIIAIMVHVEFLNLISDWFKAIREETEEEFVNIYADNYTSIKEFIFKDTRFNDFGSTSVLHMLLSGYYYFSEIYIRTKHMFLEIIGYNEDELRDEKIMDLFASMYGDNIDFQHIDFRIMNIEGKFESLYTIKSSLSLLLYEMSECIKADVNFVECPNCNQIFVPIGRSDTLYCSYPSPQNSKKTCKDIGAQIARSNKEKTDIVTGTYRKTYMRYKMMIRRHPNDTRIKKKFEKLTTEMKKWRNDLVHGIITTEDVLDWLSEF